MVTWYSLWVLCSRDGVLFLVCELSIVVSKELQCLDDPRHVHFGSNISGWLSLRRDHTIVMYRQFSWVTLFIRTDEGPAGTCLPRNSALRVLKDHYWLVLAELWMRLCTAAQTVTDKKGVSQSELTVKSFPQLSELRRASKFWNPELNSTISWQIRASTQTEVVCTSCLLEISLLLAWFMLRRRNLDTVKIPQDCLLRHRAEYRQQ